MKALVEWHRDLATFIMAILSTIAGRYQANKKMLKEEAQQLIEKTVADIPEGKIRDYHVHLVGRGTNDSGLLSPSKNVSMAQAFGKS
jgi:hypothetical protein